MAVARRCFYGACALQGGAGYGGRESFASDEGVVHALDSVGGVNHFANLRRTGKKRNHMRPEVVPRLGNLRIRGGENKWAINVEFLVNRPPVTPIWKYIN